MNLIRIIKYLLIENSHCHRYQKKWYIFKWYITINIKICLLIALHVSWTIFHRFLLTNILYRLVFWLKKRDYEVLYHIMNLLTVNCRKPEGKSNLGKRMGILNVLHRDVHWTRQHLEVSIYRVWKRWWCFPNSIYLRAFSSRKTVLLLGNDNGPVHQQLFGEDMVCR